MLIWGDSFAQHLNAGLDDILPKSVARLQVATSGCAPALPVALTAAESACEKSNRFAVEVARKETPDVVIIAQHDHQSVAAFRQIAELLRSVGVRRVIALGPVPQWKPDLNKVVARYYWDSTPERIADYLDKSIVITNQRLGSDLRPDEPFILIDLFAALCNEKGCLAYIDGDKRDGLMAYDYGHFTPAASRYVMRTIVGPVLLKALGRASVAGSRPDLDVRPRQMEVPPGSTAFDLSAGHGH